MYLEMALGACFVEKYSFAVSVPRVLRISEETNNRCWGVVNWMRGVMSVTDGHRSFFKKGTR